MFKRTLNLKILITKIFKANKSQRGRRCAQLLNSKKIYFHYTMSSLFRNLERNNLMRISIIIKI